MMGRICGLLALGACSFDGSTATSSSPSPGVVGGHCADGVLGAGEVDTDCGGEDCQPCVGTGEDGSITIIDTVDLNLRTLADGRVCPDGGDAVAYSVVGLDASSAQLSRIVSEGCLSPGDEVLLMNIQGTSITENVGVYESLRVASVSGDQVSFSHAKRWSYGEAGDANIGIDSAQQRVLLQRVPNYSSLTITADGALTASAFNGLVGGVLAVRASGLVDVQGAIELSATGYRGGVSELRGPETLSGIQEQGGGGGGGGSGGHDGDPDEVCQMAMPGMGANGAQSGYCGQSGSAGFDPCPQASNICDSNSCGGDGIGGGGGGGAGFGYDTGEGGASLGGGKGGNKQGGAGQPGEAASAGQGGGGGGGAAGRDSAGGGGGGRALSSFSNISPEDLSIALFGGGAAAGAGGGGGGGAGDYHCAAGGSGGGAEGFGGVAGSDTCGAADAMNGSKGGNGGAGGGMIMLYSQRLVVSGSGRIHAEGGVGGAGGAGGRGAAIGGCGTGRGGGGGGGGGGADGAAGGSIYIWSYAPELGDGRVSALGGIGGAAGEGSDPRTSSGGGGAGDAGREGAKGRVTVTAIDGTLGTSEPPYFARQP